MTKEIADAYDAAADTWAAGSARLYAAVASQVARRAPDLAGCRVVDIGAGTGVLGRALLDRGAREVVALDLATGMLAKAGPGITPVVGDATALPFGDGSFDLAATAFCLSHLPDPVVGMREARRVAGRLLSCSFVEGWTHPAKAVVDDVLSQVGYRPPAWYLTTKERSPVDCAEDLPVLARAAGYASAEVVPIDVDTGECDPEWLAKWRLGMAQIAPFFAALDPTIRERVRTDIHEALEGMPPVVVSILVLTAA